jgi:hypothetical protein
MQVIISKLLILRSISRWKTQRYKEKDKGIAQMGNTTVQHKKRNYADG